MRALVVVAALSAVASADSLHTLGLARDRTTLLDARVTARLAEGMAVLSDQASAVLDWGATRFTLAASMTPRRRPDLRELIASDRELGSAKLERLASDAPEVAYGAAPNLPRLDHGRALIYVAYLTAPEEATAVFRFYVSEDGIDDALAWAAVARSIVATIKICVPPSSHVPRPSTPVEPPPVTLPVGWTLISGSATQHIRSDHGTCDVQDGELDVRSTAPVSASHAPGKMRGVAMYWSVWSDRAGYHAETMVGAARQGQVHVQCLATGAAEIARQREVIEALWR